MRSWIAAVALGTLLALPCPAPAPAVDPDDEPTEDELLDEHMGALRDYQNAETDEEADKAQKRFEDAEQRERKLQRDRLNDALKR